MRFDSERGELEFGRFRINVFGEEEDIMRGELVDGGKRRGFLFTDRPVYRPGEIVHVKGIVRSYTPGESHMAAGVKATLRVKGRGSRDRGAQGDALGHRLIRYGHPASERTVGGFFAQLVFRRAMRTRTGATSACGWTVQEYSPNAFEVKVTPPKTPMLGAPIELPIDREILHGQGALEGAARVVRARHGRGFTPTGFEDFVFTDALL